MLKAGKDLQVPLVLASHRQGRLPSAPFAASPILPGLKCFWMGQPQLLWAICAKAAGPCFANLFVLNKTSIINSNSNKSY